MNIDTEWLYSGLQIQVHKEQKTMMTPRKYTDTELIKIPKISFLERLYLKIRRK